MSAGEPATKNGHSLRYWIIGGFQGFVMAPLSLFALLTPKLQIFYPGVRELWFLWAAFFVLGVAANAFLAHYQRSRDDSSSPFHIFPSLHAVAALWLLGPGLLWLVLVAIPADLFAPGVLASLYKTRGERGR